MIDILISTSNDRIIALADLRLLDNVHYVIVHQVFPDFVLSHNALEASQLLEQREDITYLKVIEKGLSKSRNRAIKASRNKYALIADDDIQFNYSGIFELVERMSNENIQIASGRHQFFSGKLAKSYKASSFLLNTISAASVSSVDMILDIEAIRKHGVTFDERFGLGAELPSGEEYIFINDVLNAGLRAKYYPITLAYHPDEVSGHDFFSTPIKAIAKREMFVRCFPKSHYIYRLLFWIKKLPIVIKNRSLLRFTRNILWR